MRTGHPLVTGNALQPAPRGKTSGEACTTSQPSLLTVALLGAWMAVAVWEAMAVVEAVASAIDLAAGWLLWG